MKAFLRMESIRDIDGKIVWDAAIAIALSLSVIAGCGFLLFMCFGEIMGWWK